MKNFLHILALTSLIGLGAACNDDTEDPGDTGVDDDVIAEDATAGDVDAEAADADTGKDPLETWPGQEIDEDPLGIEWDMPASDDGLKFLIANVGNIDVMRCSNVGFNLCWVEQEAIITAEIAARGADVILLQEVLVPEQCDSLDADDIPDDHVCHPDHQPEIVDQARRLVGPDYTIACDSRNGYECIATRVGSASIEGCDDGEYCRDLARTGEPVDGCDPGFTASAVTIEFDGDRLDVVNVHPPSNAPSIDDPQQCRHDYFLNFFGDDAALIEQDRVLVGGDFNFDPYRNSQSNVDVELWNQFVSTSYDDTVDDLQAFAYHSGLPEHDPPYWTTPILDTTLDHVISNTLRGRCITLGAHPGEAPLDHFHGQPIERLDHLAIECILE